MTGKVAIVSGGTGALGQSVCARLLGAGATVCVPYHVPAELEALRTRLEPAHQARLDAVRADVTDEKEFGAFVRGVLDRHRRVDILVNGVGGFAGGELAATSLADWQRMLALNLTSAFIGCRGVLPAMLAARAGRIVNIASRAVVPPAAGFIAYTVSKAGVITLTQALADGLAQGARAARDDGDLADHRRRSASAWARRASSKSSSVIPLASWVTRATLTRL